jgi:(1->4)-alpha-D-glucan 1-alpha-D-glucosylmutase
MDETEQAQYLGRIQDYLIKAIKEAKVNSSWVQPNEEWENAVREFVAKLLGAGANRFLENFEVLAERVAQLGMVNSLAQTVLKAAVPGMPDFYQGTELWDFSLVDPDNRRPVDYEVRRQWLSSLQGVEASVLLQEWRDGRIKLHVTHQLLNFRRSHSALFMQGSFNSVNATGACSDSCVAFVRRFEGSALLVILPRLTARVGFPPVGDVWRDTALEWPEEFIGREVSELFSGVKFTVSGTSCAIAEALRVLPVAAFALV